MTGFVVQGHIFCWYTFSGSFEGIFFYWSQTFGEKETVNYEIQLMMPNVWTNVTGLNLIVPTLVVFLIVLNNWKYINMFSRQFIKRKKERKLCYECSMWGRVRPWAQSMLGSVRQNSVTVPAGQANTAVCEQQVCSTHQGQTLPVVQLNAFIRPPDWVNKWLHMNMSGNIWFCISFKCKCNWE